MTDTTVYESIVLQAYWFSEGKFWNLGADGYINDDDPDDPVNLEVNPTSLDPHYEKQDVEAELRMIGSLFMQSYKPRRGISLQFEGSEFEFLSTEAA